MTDNAKDFFEAVKNGDPEAQYLMGLRYENGTHGLTQNFERAEQWYKQAADNGNRDAVSALAKLRERISAQSYQQAEASVNEQAKQHLMNKEGKMSTVVSNDDWRTKKIISSLSNVWIKIIAVSIIVGGLIFALHFTMDSLLAAGNLNLRDIKTTQALLNVLLGIIYLIVGCFSIWIINLFFKSLGEIIRLLLEIKNLLKDKK